MIRYALKCSEGHKFESWFQSADAFDALAASRHLTCAICGDTQITKDMMAPRVAPKTKPERPATTGQHAADSHMPQPAAGALTAPQSGMEKALAAMKAHVEANATYVGGDFAKKAREMHLGEAPEASIYGEAKPEEAKALIEDGIPVAPLPFRPKTKSN